MATYAHSTPVSAPALPGVFARAYNAVLNWNSARVTRNQLMKLTDRELEDIGLHRDQIMATVRKLHG